MQAAMRALASSRVNGPSSWRKALPISTASSNSIPRWTRSASAIRAGERCTVLAKITPLIGWSMLHMARMALEVRPIL